MRTGSGIPGYRTCHAHNEICWKRRFFGTNNTTPDGPLIWLDSSRRNFDQVTYGLYTVIGDVRQGPKHNNGEFHEALTSYNALIRAGLLGIDKTNQHGYNFVKMAQNYFNSATKWNIVMNNTNPEVAMAGGGYGRDWWYDVYPNVLYCGVAALFPKVENTEMIQRSVANQFYKADSVLQGNYNYSYFDYAKMKGMQPLVSLVKYEPQYAKAIGKYMLNVVNASRLFYPDQVDNAHQWLPALRDITHGIIGYEGIRKMDDYNNQALKGISPVKPYLL
jgi:hypothetical protein